MIYDTHCHPHLAKNKNTTQVIKNFLEQNPKGFLNIIWTNIQTNSDILEISSKYDRVYLSIWIHPCDIYDLDLEKAILSLENNILKNKNKIVAIWECGLDYYWLKPENDTKIANYDKKHQLKIIKQKKQLQKLFFKSQIILAQKYSLPLIIHNRESKDDIFEILKQSNFKNFIFHSYSEDLDYAKKLINFSQNCKIAFSGIVTFKNAINVQETVKNIPLENILVETDSPYLTPAPFRWKQENEPIFTKYVLEKIIELRDEKQEKIKKQIFENSCETFWIKKD